jgi:hypothetical protein
MTELAPLTWHWLESRPAAEAWDGRIRYFVSRRKNGRWFVKMNGSIIGEKNGFASFDLAVQYIDYGGDPLRHEWNDVSGQR